MLNINFEINISKTSAITVFFLFKLQSAAS